LTEVELAKVEYETAVMAKLPAIKAKIEEKAEAVLKGARADKKATVYSAFLREEVFKEVTGNSQQAVKYKTALERLGVAVESLQATVKASVAAYTHFLDHCSDLFTGKGTYDEYLLDQCSQTSEECLDGAGGFGRHAGCCCGYTPFMAVGLEKVGFGATIPGIEAAALKDDGGLARVGNRLRRLADEPKSYYDICGSVWEGNADILASFHTGIASLGTDAVFQDWLNAMKKRYPDADLCVFQEGATGGNGPTGGNGGDDPKANGPTISSVGGADGTSARLPTLVLTALALASLAAAA